MSSKATDTVRPVLIHFQPRLGGAVWLYGPRTHALRAAFA